MVNEMLTQMESFFGVFIASTNLVDDLDQAALRRFDLKVRFDFMDADQSRALLIRYCKSLALSGPLPETRGHSGPTCQSDAWRFCGGCPATPVSPTRVGRRVCRRTR